MRLKIYLCFIAIGICLCSNAQNKPKTVWPTVSSTALYDSVDTATNLEDSVTEETSQINLYDTIIFDSTTYKRLQDSIQLRMRYIEDSLLARKQFIEDSIQKRQHRLDSLHLIRNLIPKYIRATWQAQNEDLIINHKDVNIIGDSMLSNYRINILPLILNKPYSPWINNISLNNPGFSYTLATDKKYISHIKTTGIDCRYQYNPGMQVLILHQHSKILTNRKQNYYAQPIDSVFFNASGNIYKIKKYSQLYKANTSYQKGQFLFNRIEEVKQYVYRGNQLSTSQIVKFRKVWNAYGNGEVSTITDFTLSYTTDSIKLKRKNTPDNDFSDGLFTFVFDDKHNLSSMSFKNALGKENRTTYVKTNELGFVINYFYEIDGKIGSGLMINYFFDDHGNTNRYETITSTFAEDGISYYQKNNTTGYYRNRDRFTGEWSDWTK